MKSNIFFYEHPVFRYEEFVQWQLQQGHKRPEVIKNALHYHLKAGHLQHLRRGLYAVLPPNKQTLLSLDPYLIAGKATSDSILAHHTALELHGVAYSVFNQFYFLTQGKAKAFELEQQWYRPVTTAFFPEASDECVMTIIRQGVSIRITDLERTFVDVIDKIELNGGWEEVMRSMNQTSVLDIEKVIRYCLLRDNQMLAAKVGFFLEQREGAFAVTEKILAPLLQKKPATAQSLLIRQRTQEKGTFVKKWNIIVPASALEENWEEPHYDV